MTANAKFKNGDIVRDTVSGYEGMVVATVLWLNGCYRYVIQAQKLQENGEPVKDVSIDEHQLACVETKQHVGKHSTGGPRPPVARGQDVRR